ncbi:MAG: LysM peptidoglycan-binding domain-containing protein [Acidiferrobacteraceae bacterium]
MKAMSWVFRGAGVAAILLSMIGCATNPALMHASLAPSGASSTATAYGTSTHPATVNTPALNNPHQQQYANLWARIRAGFRLPPMEGPYVAQQEQWFADNPQYMERMLQRANLYLYQIVQEVQKRHMPMEIALLPAIESAYRPSAYSRARAVGLWQFTSSTGRLYGLKRNWWYDERRDVLASTNAALDYLQNLHRDFHGSWDLALAAYNAGEGTVMQAIAHNRALGLSTSYSELPLPRETELYVPKLMAMVNIVRDPAKFGLTLREIPNDPYFVKVRMRSPVDLGVVAKLANVSMRQLHRMNPAFNRWSTGPGGPKHLLVPVSAKEAVIQGLKDLPPQDRIQWARHLVRPGDTLYEIARHYGVTVWAIRSSNHLHTNFLRVGEHLLIPVSGRRLIVTRRVPHYTRPAVHHYHATIHPYVRMVRYHQRVRIVHRVRAGESLWSIARRYNVYVSQLARWNYIGVRNVLKLGQKLLIWTSPRVASAAER